MKREYWLDKLYWDKNWNAWSSYECEEIYQDYKQALQEYNETKTNLKDNEAVEFWVVDWDDEEDEMIDYKVKYHFEKKGKVWENDRKTIKRRN